MILALLLAACASQPAAQPQGTATQAPAPETGEQPAGEEALKVGVFVDNAFGDRAFFDIALEGIPLIEEKYNAEVTRYEGRLQPDNFVPILTDAAKNNELVFVLGFEAIDAMSNVAKEYPDTTFVFIDAPLGNPDLVSLAYKDQEGCFVAGALAALLTTHTEVENINPDKVIGFVGGVDAPVIQRCLSGYTQGAAYVDPEVTVESIFVGSFVDPAKGKEANLALVDKGSDINYQYAGLSGEGGFNAAKEGAPMYTIGAGFDQRWLAPDATIGSMLKRVDLSIEYLTGLYANGELKKGQDFFWGLKEGGVPFTYSEDLVPAEVVTRAKEIEQQITNGEITVTE
jgi:basic membrane protein A